MKKYHFTHEPCSLIRAVKHCASHSHFDERFPLRTLARWHSVPLLLMQVGIAHRTLRAEEEQHCCALLAFPMAPGGWVGVKGVSHREEMWVLWSCCPHGSLEFAGGDADGASHPTRSCCGEKLTDFDPSCNKHCHSRKPPQLHLTQGGCNMSNGFTGSCPKACGAGRTSVSPQHLTELTAHHCHKAMEVALG